MEHEAWGMEEKEKFIDLMMQGCKDAMRCNDAMMQ